MKTSKLTRLIAFFLAAVCCVGTIVITGSASAPVSPADPGEEVTSSSSYAAMSEYLDAIPYSEYYATYRNIPAGTADVVVDLTTFTANAEASGTKLLSA
ncbi:MAG: hypothetical protein J6Z13_06215, partial [Clostridia bacterium]|nr:hypothetical protein [Clostridia bacterium]